MDPLSTNVDPFSRFPQSLSCALCDIDSDNGSDSSCPSEATSDAARQPYVHPPLQAEIAWSDPVRQIGSFGSLFEISASLPPGSVINRSKGLVAVLFEEAISTFMEQIDIRKMSITYFGLPKEGDLLNITAQYNFPRLDGIMSRSDGKCLATVEVHCSFTNIQNEVTRPYTLQHDDFSPPNMKLGTSAEPYEPFW
ncbi:hypothetical protein BJX96DRAFT_178831 [Aspergillus floccosus]